MADREALARTCLLDVGRTRALVLSFEEHCAALGYPSDVVAAARETAAGSKLRWQSAKGRSAGPLSDGWTC
jgi:hypothetical protein